MSLGNMLLHPKMTHRSGPPEQVRLQSPLVKNDTIDKPQPRIGLWCLNMSDFRQPQPRIHHLQTHSEQRKLSFLPRPRHWLLLPRIADQFGHASERSAEKR